MNRTANRRVHGNSTVKSLYHDPIPSVYLPPRPVAMAARIRGAAAVLAALAVEAPEGTDLRKHLEREAFAVAALAGSEAAA